MLALEHEKDLLFDRLQEIAKAEALELAAEHNGALFGGLLAGRGRGGMGHAITESLANPPPGGGNW